MSIRKVAKDTEAEKFRRELRYSLKAFTTSEQTTRGPGVFELIGPNEVKYDPPDNQAFVRSLYEAVSRYCLCECPQGWGNMTVNLRFNWSCNEKYAEDDAVPFSLLFLDHHQSGTSDNPCRWQDTQISVFQKRSKSVRSSNVDTQLTFPTERSNSKMIKT
jgi:hypothetical protein